MQLQQYKQTSHSKLLKQSLEEFKKHSKASAIPSKKPLTQDTVTFRGAHQGMICESK